jgi:glutamyl-tRNA synthetase
MHVGNLRTALYAFLLARSQHGRFILRIEDTDQARYVDGAVEVIYSTLKAAGITHDEGPDVGGDYGPYIQSQRKNLYLPYAEQLVAKGAAYYCFCDPQSQSDEGGDTDSAVSGYDGHCRSLSPEIVKANLDAKLPYVIRQKIDKTGVSTYRDAVYGEITIENKVLDDQILIKRDGMPTYNFANVIDDHTMGITHVVRGCEYLPSTPKYNLLYRAFGWEIPEYVHLPLIMGRDTEGNVSKLSKRHGSVSFEGLIADGYLPEAVVNYIALLGWSPKNDRELFTLAELEGIFSVHGLNKSAAVFDYDKLTWMNGEYLKALNAEEFARVSLPFAQLHDSPLEVAWQLIAPLLQQRVGKLTEIPEKIGFLSEQPEYSAELFYNKKSKATPETAKAAFDALLPKFEALNDWSIEALNGIMSGYAEALEIKLGQVMWAIRIGVSGLAVTPGGPAEIMVILGKAESLRRLCAASAK